MKSFSNPAEENATRSVRAWMPADFQLREPAQLTSALELLEILSPLPGRVPVESDEEENKRLIRVGEAAHSRLTSWDPGDFEQVQAPAPKTSGSRPLPDSVFPALAFKPPERRPERRAERAPEVHTPLQAVGDEKKQAEMMAEARVRADLLIQQAQASAAEILRRAQDEARQAVAQGFTKGREEGQAEAASSIQAAQAIIAETAAWRDQIVAQSEEVVIDMIRHIARLMFGEGLQLDKNALQVYLNGVMETTRSLGELNIFLSPSDYRQLDAAWAEYYTQIRGIRVTVIGSNNILPGGCYVQGQMGTVDARVETKLEAVMETLVSEPESGAAE
jgi:flagellar biosynthesis/type III secretory pathway protein FliH